MFCCSIEVRIDSCINIPQSRLSLCLHCKLHSSSPKEQREEFYCWILYHYHYFYTGIFLLSYNVGHILSLLQWLYLLSEGWLATLSLWYWSHWPFAISGNIASSDTISICTSYWVPLFIDIKVLALRVQFGYFELDVISMSVFKSVSIIMMKKAWYHNRYS